MSKEDDERVKTLQEYTGWDAAKCQVFLESQISTKKVQLDTRLLREAMPQLAEVGLLSGGVVEFTLSVPYQWLDEFRQILKDIAEANGRKFIEGNEDFKLN